MLQKQLVHLLSSWLHILQIVMFSCGLPSGPFGKPKYLHTELLDLLKRLLFVFAHFGEVIWNTWGLPLLSIEKSYRVTSPRKDADNKTDVV